MKFTHFFLTAMLSAGIVLSSSSGSFAQTVDNHDAVHSANGPLVHSTNGNCVRTQWVSAGDECQTVQPAPQPAAHTQPAVQQPIADEARTVYFEFNKTTLLGSEQQKLDSLSDTLKAMHHISGVTIVGYADRIGSASYNERLSQQRAHVVEKYLKARGYLNATVAKTSWLGETVPLTQCHDGMERTALVMCLQQDRRVTVEIQYNNSTH